jgi:hypothetical protein
VHPANVQDRAGARLVLTPLIGQVPRLERLWADGGYAGQMVPWVAEQGWTLEIVAKNPTATGFQVLPEMTPAHARTGDRSALGAQRPAAMALIRCSCHSPH